MYLNKLVFALWTISRNCLRPVFPNAAQIILATAAVPSTPKCNKSSKPLWQSVICLWYFFGAHPTSFIVDAHLHRFKAASKTYLRNSFSFYPPEREALLRIFLKVMEANNVKKAVIVPLEMELKLLGEVLSQYRGRVAGIAEVIEHRQDYVLDFVRRRRKMGIQGVGMGKTEDGKTSSFTILEKAGLLRPMATSSSLL